MNAFMKPMAMTVALLAAGATLSAQDLTTLQVAVEVDSTLALYNRQLNPAQRDSLKRIVADSLVVRLARRAPFLHYVAGDSGPYRLTVILDRRNRSTRSSFDDVGLHARVTAGGVDSTEYWTKIRDGAAPGGVGQFRDIRLSLLTAIETAEYGTLSKLLQRVPVARGGVGWSDPTITGWVLPYGRGALCMETQSRLLVVNELPTAVGPQEQSYSSVVTGDFLPDPVPAGFQVFRGNAFSRAEASPSDLVELKRAIERGGTRVVAVYVVEYRFQPNLCLRPEDPIAGSAGTGGAP